MSSAIKSTSKLVTAIQLHVQVLRVYSASDWLVIVKHFFHGVRLVELFKRKNCEFRGQATNHWCKCEESRLVSYLVEIEAVGQGSDVEYPSTRVTYPPITFLLWVAVYCPLRVWKQLHQLLGLRIAEGITYREWLLRV